MAPAWATSGAWAGVCAGPRGHWLSERRRASWRLCSPRPGDQPQGRRVPTHLLGRHLQFQKLRLSAQHVPGRVDLHEPNPVDFCLEEERRPQSARADVAGSHSHLRSQLQVVQSCHTGRLPPVPSLASLRSTPSPLLAGGTRERGQISLMDNRRRARRAWREVPDPKHPEGFQGDEPRAPEQRPQRRPSDSMQPSGPHPRGLSALSSWSRDKGGGEDGPSGLLLSSGSGHTSARTRPLPSSRARAAWCRAWV